MNLSLEDFIQVLQQGVPESDSGLHGYKVRPMLFLGSVVSCAETNLLSGSLRCFVG